MSITPDDTSVEGARPPPLPERLGGVLFFATGAALVTHIVFGLPLWATFFGGVVLAALTLSWLARRVGVDLNRVIRVGLTSGAIATAAYDLSRIAIVGLAGLDSRPFAAWPLFGAALIGEQATSATQWIVGGAFHVTNGLAFAVAYTYWFAGRGPIAGIAFALVLEGFMLSLYPGWLNISSYAPFVIMSLTGHLVYGSVLGILARRMSRNWAVA